MKDPAHVAAGRIGALRLHGTHDSRQLTTNGRAAFLRKFRDQVLAADAALASALASPDDTKRQAAEKEVERRSAYLRQHHFALMAYNREKARKARKNKKASEATAIAPDAP